MGDTTLTIADETKERMKPYRAPSHGSWSETIDALLEILPSADSLDAGCQNCGQETIGHFTSRGGVLRWFHYENPGGGSGGVASNYYCSVACLSEMQEEVDNHFPEDPDLVVVGGKDQYRVEVEGATFGTDRMAQWVGLDVPGAFDGESSHGDDYEYVGEPVYIKNAGQWVQQFVIEDIVHEEGHTTLFLEHDYHAAAHHPDDQRREEYREEMKDREE